MKQIVLIMGLILILIPFISAGESYDIDFSDGSTYVITLTQGDEIRVYYNGTHSIILDQINYAEKILNFEMFINMKSFTRGLVYENTELRVDFERDLVPDISIEIFEIDNEDTATVIIKDIQYQEPDSTGYTIKDKMGLVPKDKTLLKYLLIGILVLIGILSFRSFGKPTEIQVENENPKTEIPPEVEEELEKEESE